MARITVRTEYGAKLQSNLLLKKNHTIPNYGTLNTWFGVVSPTNAAGDCQDVLQPFLPTPLGNGQDVCAAYDPSTDTENMGLRVLVLGNGGHLVIPAPTGGVPYTAPKPHKATDAAPWNAIPLKAVDITGGGAALTADDSARVGFCLRRVIHKDGKVWAIYFGKILDFTGINVAENILTTINGVITPTPFVPNSNNLRLPPYVTAANPTATMVEVAATMPLQLTAADVASIVDACSVLYGNPNYAIISEIALCNAALRSITQQTLIAGGGTRVVGANIVEAVGVQVNTFVSSYNELVNANDGVDLTMDVGATEALYGNLV